MQTDYWSRHSCAAHGSVLKITQIHHSILHNQYNVEVTKTFTTASSGEIFMFTFTDRNNKNIILTMSTLGFYMEET